MTDATLLDQVVRTHLTKADCEYLTIVAAHGSVNDLQNEYEGFCKGYITRAGRLIARILLYYKTEQGRMACTR